MKRILKYKLEFDIIGGTCDITMPMGAEVLSVQLQGNDIVVWVIADDAFGYPTENKHFCLFMTGEVCTGWRKDEHIATLQDNGIVVHIFLEE